MPTVTNRQATVPTQSVSSVSVMQGVLMLATVVAFGSKAILFPAAMGFPIGAGRARARAGADSLSHLPVGRTTNALRFASWDDFMGDIDNLLTNQESKDTSAANETQAHWCTILPPLHSSESNIATDSDSDSEPPSLPPSPVDVKIIEGRRVFIKRDDLLRLPGSQISGNKARKMLALNELPVNLFPSCIVSYGGPQSNSMLALAAVANFKNRQLSTTDPPIRFVYYTKTLPTFLRKQASGNLFRALQLGMEIVALPQKEYHELFGGDSGGAAQPPVCLAPPGPGSSLWIPQGGAFEMARRGANILAQEVLSFWKREGDNNPLSLVLPGGTCTTAVLVHHALKTLQSEVVLDDDRVDVQVVVVPCVGDAGYAQRQMMSMSSQIGALADDIPAILSSSPESHDAQDYFPFGEPNAAILKVFNLLNEKYDLLVDLVYGSPTWAILLRHWRTPLATECESFDPKNPIAGREIMYVHSGGLEGINSQLLRYKYKGLVQMKDVQPP